MKIIQLALHKLDGDILKEIRQNIYHQSFSMLMNSKKVDKWMLSKFAYRIILQIYLLSHCHINIWEDCVWNWNEESKQATWLRLFFSGEATWTWSALYSFSLMINFYPIGFFRLKVFNETVARCPNVSIWHIVQGGVLWIIIC